MAKGICDTVVINACHVKIGPTPIEIGPMSPFLTSKLDRGSPILTDANSPPCRVRHASIPFAKYVYVVDTLDDMSTLLSVHKVLSLKALGLWILISYCIDCARHRYIGQRTRRTLGA